MTNLNKKVLVGSYSAKKFSFLHMAIQRNVFGGFIFQLAVAQPNCKPPNLIITNLSLSFSELEFKIYLVAKQLPKLYGNLLLVRIRENNFRTNLAVFAYQLNH